MVDLLFFDYYWFTILVYLEIICFTAVLLESYIK